MHLAGFVELVLVSLARPGSDRVGWTWTFELDRDNSELVEELHVAHVTLNALRHTSCSSFFLYVHTLRTLILPTDPGLGPQLCEDRPPGGPLL